MGVKERRQRERTQVRERILDAALDVFAKEGAEGVTMRALADAIEYSPPVIYAHFRDKDAIIQELCNRQLRQLAQVFATFGTLDPVERLRNIGYVYADFAIDNPSHFRFLFLTPHTYSAEEAQLSKDDPERNGYAFLKQTVKDCMALGAFRDAYTDADEIAQICWASAHGLVALQNIKRVHTWVDWRDARTTAHRLVDATLNGLVKPELVSPAIATPATKSRSRSKAR